ncbi:male sterility protein 2-related [Holotrichia oblita]|uniref:Male sterility protein 2-related n=1 Tax=Holotrichia oblita TaxID=644536 RepID=A0ACB9TUH7_HOLOL|nr:male sterility protein 2-related [Holotrichia oblita]
MYIFFSDTMDEKDSVVAAWYKGKNIFVTGGTGFMGKVLVEKLLYSCSDLGTLYILMRPKKGKSSEERLKDMWALPVFVRVRTKNPKLFDKVVPINGEISEEGLGISQEDRKTLIENVHIVFHLAAILRLEAQLKDSIEMNTMGTQRTLALAKDMKKLDIFIHLSTAFCSPDIDEFEEKIYESPFDPVDVINTAKWMPAEALVKATPDLIKPHPNTYTFTKRLGETLVANEAKNVRVAIVRPSIVTPSAWEPVPGWVDSLNGPIGVMAAAGKGVLRTMQCNEDNYAQVIPVDIAINAILVIAWKHGSVKLESEEVPVYNLTNDEVLRYTWGEVLHIGKKICYQYPFEMQVWYPNGAATKYFWVYFIWSIFVHWIPALLIDTLMLIFLQPRFMIRIQKRIYVGLGLLHFFTLRNWIFKSQNFLSLAKDLNPVDIEIFQMNFHRHSVETYFLHSLLGGRHYCLKENPESLPRCRIQQKVLYIVDKLFKLLLIYGIFCLAWSYSDTVKYLTSLIGYYVNNALDLGKAVLRYNSKNISQ